MNFGKKLSDFYWAIKESRLSKNFNKNPACYFLYLPRVTQKIFVDIYIKAGALSEKENEAGIGHLLEHYLSELALRGLPDNVKFGAKISDDYILFYLESENDETLCGAIDILFGVLVHPDFSRRDIFDYEKSSLINELENEKNDTELALERLVEGVRYIDEPNSRSFVDHLPTIRNLTIEDIANYHKKILTRDNLVIFVSAVKQNPKIQNSIKNNLARINLPGGLAKFPRPTYSDFETTIEESPGITGNYAVITFPSPNRSMSLKDRIALSLMIEYVRDPESKGIRQSIREKGVYDFRVIQTQGIHNGYIAIRSFLAKDQILPWIKAINSLIRALKDTGPDRSLFRRIKEKWTSDILAYWRNNEGRFKILTSFILEEEEISGPRMTEIRKIIRSVDEEDIRRIANVIFNISNTNLILFGDHTGLNRAELEQMIVV